jgi:hypothetical protein
MWRLIQRKKPKIIYRLINSSFLLHRMREILNIRNHVGLYQKEELPLAHGLHHQWNTASGNRGKQSR